MKNNIALHGWLATADLSAQSHILELLKPHTFTKGSLIHHIGEKANGLYFVDEGAVRIKKGNEEGKDLIIKDLLPGEWFGFIACFGSGIRPNDAIAIEPSQVFHLSLSSLNRVLEKYPSLALPIANQLASYVEYYNACYENAIFMPLSQRLQVTLAQLCQWQGASELVISQQELAGMLGVTKEAIGIHLNILKTQGIVEIGYRRIIFKADNSSNITGDITP